MRYLLFLTCFIIISCTSGSKDSSAVFRYNQVDGISTLDPAFAKSQSIMWATHQLYNSLIDVDDSLRLVPCLARSWNTLDNGKRYRFILRDSIYFHDDPAFAGGKGRKMVASDVVFSLSRIIDRSVASPGAWIFTGRVDTLLPFRAVNDSVFELRLLKPFPPIIGILSMKYCSIVPREAVEYYGSEFRRHPCGTGPFRLAFWEEGQSLVMHRNPNYFERDSSGSRLPYLDAVKVSFFDNKATEFLEFRQGRLDFINDIEASFKDEVLTKRGELKAEWQGRIKLNKHDYLNTEYLGFLQDTANPILKNSFLRDKRVRQAMSHAIDRRKMMLYLRNSIGTPAISGFIPAGFPSFNAQVVKGYDYDPEKARQLLQASGYFKNKELIHLKTIPVYAELGSFIAKQLEEIGMLVQVDVVQRATLLEETAKSKALFFRASWIADYPDAENYLNVFYGGNPAPPNYTRYRNPRFDALYDQILQETNDSIRFATYRKMDQLIMDDAPVIPLWYDMAIHLVQPRVKGFTANGRNMLELRKVQLLK